MTTVVKARCHCGLNSFNIPFATASLPITNDLCHCTSCQHSTGQLMVNHVAFLGAPLSGSAATDSNEPADLSTLTPYKTSASATRWFCSRCSAHILWEYNNTTHPSWCVAVGTLERTEGIVKTGYHIWVADTLDGGIADHLRVVDGLELPRYIAGVKECEVVPAKWRSADILEDSRAHSQELDRILAYCHCRAISFWITRPSAASAQPSSPYPDLMHPYISTPKDKVANPNDEKWWLRPGVVNSTHYLAGHCACTSCRLTSGFEIQSWAFIPKANLLFPRPGAAPATTELIELNLQDDDLRPAGLRRYRSSAGRNREFCGTCGATVFWWGEERPELVDVAVGLVDEKVGGSRAEGWFEWWRGRVSFEEDAVNKGLVQGLVEGLRA
ncbi:hypothetical protein D9615_005955 [Tricholomella constricta]|uniref:CENP-V/GFA domain-containing protein n=1 Tax=Tricholomella constricta TaxID=117010 RepID=A0A8H5H9I0_9AGAR|nr:hypothetical protein D9615_005955 [Tricholomella constricta]